MFHHLGMNERTRTLSEVRRVLKPGGSFHMVDFVKVRNRGPAFFPSTVDVLESLSRSGFVDVRKVNDGSLLLGIMRIAYYRASAA
jgi:ubiquinone/menaquinone biosynthesis C-methylase UbiE